ncbi:hypothetical protein K8R03_01550 [Candidatus Kaiserbacteria bacterium]|nr:hypothetical protein [Candidatus Kaiserbacteria bacterium]
MKWVNKACSVSYEVAFVLFFALAALAPLHGMATRHLTVVQTFDATHAAIEGDVSGLAAGDVVTLYRFNHDWKSPIGKATVETVTPQTARIAIQEGQMQWPLGRHGLVTRADDGSTYVSLGEIQGMKVDGVVNLFRERLNVGQARIIKVEEGRSQISMPLNIGDVTGLTASEYIFATQAAIYKNTLLTALEGAVIFLALLAYAALYLRTKRSPFLLLGEYIRRKSPGVSSSGFVFWTVNILAGIPFVWFMAKMPLYLFAYVAGYISQHVFFHYIYLFPAMDALLPYAYALIAMFYYVYLGRYGLSPILRFWRLISYPTVSLGTGTGAQSGKQTFGRGFVLWALHLVIVYAFASTLWMFLRGDVSAVVSIGFPAPTREALFEQAKYAIWAFTVIGVLIGYGYSVISILWGKYMRNLDFSVVGWLSNGFCYPFLGVVVWQMIPSFTGVDPIITGGPLNELMLWLGLLFNILYMLSIFNLGILFDLMADKGVRWSGFYSVVRHPNYALEVSMFFVTELVGLASGVQWLAIMMYFFIYWIRSEREDNFMEYSNPEYAQYQKASPYKFIPGLY